MEKCFKNIRKEKEKARSAGTSSNKNLYLPDWKFFRCGSEDHLIVICPNPPKDSEKRRKSENPRKRVIVHVTTEMMTMTLKYTHIWHKCLMMTNAKIKIMAIVRN